jgi:hypothetical protein
MGTLITILGLVFRMIGLADWFEGRMQQREAAKQVQAIANTPTTNKEWTDAAKNGDL